MTGGRGTTGAGDGDGVTDSPWSSSDGSLDDDAGADDRAGALVGVSVVVEAGAPGVELPGAGGAGWLPTEPKP